MTDFGTHSTSLVFYCLRAAQTEFEAETYQVEIELPMPNTLPLVY
ncbi:hypothetical protein IC582_021309 [Cucumis melo]